MKNILTIIKKEFTRFFTDKRMVVTTLILPGLMIYLIYSFMGSGIADSFTTDEDYKYQVYAYNVPADFVSTLEDLNMEFLDESGKTIDEIKNAIKDKEIDMLIVFPENFDALVTAYQGGDGAPNIDIYYNSSKTEGSSAYNIMLQVMNSYESVLANKFDINNADDTYDLATEKDIAGQIFSMIVPLLLMIFLYSGCISVAPESIAGEKERGTIAPLLITPIKRSELALGKIISLSVIALLSGISSFVGTLLSLPKMVGSGLEGVSTSVYVVTDYLWILGITLTTVLLMIAIISVISAYAKTVKEAATMVMPVMIIVMLVGVSSMMTGGASANTALYLIPIYNSVQAYSAILSFSYSPLNVIIAIVSNLIFSGLLILLLTKMFESEKIMFNK